MQPLKSVSFFPCRNVFREFVVSLEATLCDDDAAAGDGEAARGEKAEGLGEGEVLLLLDAGVEGLGRVALKNGDGTLNDDGTAVCAGIDEVDGAPGDLGAVVEGLFPRVEAGEGRQERGVDVEDAVGEGVQETGLDDAHEPGQHDGVRAVALDDADPFLLGRAFEFGLEGGAGKILRGDAGAAGALQDEGILDIGQDADELGIQRPGVDGVEDGLHVGAGPGTEHGEAKLRHGESPPSRASNPWAGRR